MIVGDREPNKYLQSTGDVQMNVDIETSYAQQKQLAHYIVRIAVALGIVDGKEPYTGEQVAFLAETAIDTICSSSAHNNKEYAIELLRNPIYLRRSLAPGRSF